jgi:hypothetical protein
MRLWKTPERLRRLSVWLLAWVPLSIASQLIARRMPWWKWEPVREWPKFAAAAAAVIIVSLGIRRARRWALHASAIGLSAFVAVCLVYSLRQENVALGIFSIASGLAALAYVDRLRSAYRTPAIDPGLTWYQALPEAIPGLGVDWGERKGLRLSRLDLETGFVLGDLPSDGKDLPGEITLHYRGSKVTCSIERIATLSSDFGSIWAGVGVEFRNRDRDAKKDLADFIEVLRGEGHVVT